jgi:hypothetical protein
MQEQPLDRRKVLKASAGLVSVGLLASGCEGPLSKWVERPPTLDDPAKAAARFGPVDPAQRYLQLVPAGDGVIYGVQTDGVLVWHRHLGWRDGESQWAGDGRRVGIGWQVYRAVLASADGQFFALRPDGALVWYRYITTDPKTGQGHWASGSGTVLRHDFADIAQLCGGWEGVLYGLNHSGDLKWFQYRAGDGSNTPTAWAPRSGSVIASGWSGQMFADPGGVVYRLVDNMVHRHSYLAGDGSNGAGAWSELATVPTPAPNRAIFSNSDGVIYTVRLDTAQQPKLNEELLWHRLTVSGSGSVGWAPERHGAVVARGFTVADSALQGYPQRLAVTPGERLGIAVSTSLNSYHVTVARLDTAGGEAPTVFGPLTVSGRLQPFQSDYRARGCGWPDAFGIPIDANWSSGLYGVKITGPNGWQVTLPFVVRPPAPQAKFAFLWPTNTYNAYNDWDGHDQYTQREFGQPRVFSFLRPGVTAERAGGDLALLRFLATEGIAVDCYIDADLHISDGWLRHYRALVLGSHPEYWSHAMRQYLQAYLAGGGRVIYPGGNGVYEPVTFSPDNMALTFRSPDGRRHPFRDSGLPETELLGVGYNWRSFGTRAPYRVVRDHPMLAGTGLRVGQEFGGASASGIEVDTPQGLRGGARPEEIFAVGTNPQGGAAMCLVERGAGWVFSAGSLTFTEAISDQHVQQILRNVFRHAA